MTCLMRVTLVPIREIGHSSNVLLPRAEYCTDFGELIYVSRIPHAGLVRLPDVPADRRIALIAELLGRHRDALDARAVVTIRGDRVRISHPPPYGDAH